MSFEDRACYRCEHFGEGQPAYSVLTDCAHYYCPMMKSIVGAYNTFIYFQEATE